MTDSPYAGLRVLDFSTTIAGPQCTRMLADMGAEVIKVESPDGDMMRSRPPMRSGESTAFGQLNAGKHSVVLDLKQSAAVEAARALAARADVLVENYRPGVMQRLGLHYEALAPLNARLIYCSISGYGQTGPSSQLPAYAPVIHAASGFDLAHLTYQGGRQRPDYCGIFVADVLAGVQAFGAIGAALNQRHRTGSGQHIDLSMLEAMLGLTLNELQSAQFPLPMPTRPIFGPVETADGYVNVAVANEKTFQGLARAAGRADLITDPRFEKYMDRRNHWSEFMDLIEDWSRTLDSAQCLAQLERHGVPASPYRTVKEALDDPQVAHREAFTEIEDSAGRFKVLKQPYRMSGSRVHPGRVASLGQDTERVLREAGLPDALIASLR